MELPGKNNTNTGFSPRGEIPGLLVRKLPGCCRLSQGWRIGCQGRERREPETEGSRRLKHAGERG